MEQIKETKELVKFVVELGMAADKALVDGKFEMAEAALLVAPLMQAGPAFEGIDKVVEEMKNLSEESAAELVAYVRDELKLEADKVEKIIEGALELGLCAFKFVKLFKKEEVAE